MSVIFITNLANRRGHTKEIHKLVIIVHSIFWNELSWARLAYVCLTAIKLNKFQYVIKSQINAFLHCVFLNVSSDVLPGKMHIRIGCICLVLLHCVFSNVSSNCLLEQMHNHRDCICLVLLQCVFSSVFSNKLPEKLQNYTGYICLIFSMLCTFKCFLK